MFFVFGRLCRCCLIFDVVDVIATTIFPFYPLKYRSNSTVVTFNRLLGALALTLAVFNCTNLACVQTLIFDDCFDAANSFQFHLESSLVYPGTPSRRKKRWKAPSWLIAIFLLPIFCLKLCFPVHNKHKASKI